MALMLARQVTGRDKYLKFDGHFHGLTEPWLYRKADPLADDSPIVPSSGGVPARTRTTGRVVFATTPSATRSRARRLVPSPTPDTPSMLDRRCS